MPKSRKLFVIMACFFFVWLFLLSCQESSPNDASNIHSISGRVHNSTDSSAVEGAGVRVIETGDSVTTDSSGAFELSAESGNTAVLYFSAEGYQPQTRSISLEDGQSHTIVDTIYLAGCYGQIGGTIYRTDSIRFVTGATVYLKNPMDSNVIDSCTTDDSGRFNFSSIAPDTLAYLFEVTKSGFESVYWLDTIQADDSTFVNWYIKSFVMITGTVLETDSTTPLADVRVELDARTIFTDSLGMFTITNWDPGAPSYTMTISKPRYATRTVAIGSPLTDTIDIKAYLQVSLNISGLVREIDSLDGLPGVSILLKDSNVTSDSLGQFHFVDIAPVDTGHLFTIALLGYDTVVVRETLSVSDTTPGPFQIERSKGHFAGTVQLQGEADHSGALVRLNFLGLGDTIDDNVPPNLIGLNDTSDTQGDVEILRIPVGRYLIQITKPGFYNTIDTIRLIKNDTTRIDTTLDTVAATGYLEDSAQPWSLTRFARIEQISVGDSKRSPNNHTPNGACQWLEPAVRAMSSEPRQAIGRTC